MITAAMTFILIPSTRRARQAITNTLARQRLVRGLLRAIAFDPKGYLPAVGDQDQWRIGGTASPACFFCCLIALFSFGDCWGFFFCCFGG
jgi:hypothetical protein